ncbi:MAG: flagellar protein [Defluviitaleaceae bacterium]|nr:flagellar protein [Defluviitaleaceae bacterium]
METKNCPRCGRVFVQIREPICDRCVKAEEEIFEKVREYVKENPNLTIKEVSEQCDVSTKKILQYIRDGRLEAGQGMKGEIVCSKCGKHIFIGRMCETCILETGFQINDMREASKIKNKGQVFTSRR